MTALATDELSLSFAALADPTRRAILTRLSAGEATVGQLAEPFALTQQAISKHLKVLERAGLSPGPVPLRPGRARSSPPGLSSRQTGWTATASCGTSGTTGSISI